MSEENEHLGLDGFKKYEMDKAFSEMLDFVFPLVSQQKTYFDECIKQGFTEEQALKSSVEFVRTILTMGGKSDE